MLICKYIFIYVYVFADTILHYVIKRRGQEGTRKIPIPKGKIRRFILIFKMHAQLMLRAKKEKDTTNWILWYC